MTIASHVSAETLLGDGANRKFPFTFRAWEGEVRVVVTGPDDRATDVTGLAKIILNEPGGVVTYPAASGSPALPVGWRLTILRNMNFLQDKRLVNAARFDPLVIEQALDRLTATDQQLAEEVGRAITLVEGAAQTPAGLLDKIFSAESNAVNAAGAAAGSAGASAASQAQAGQLAAEAGLCAQAAQAAQEAAASAEEMARQWAENPKDVPVRGSDEFSAYHWAQRAGDYSRGQVPEATEDATGISRYGTESEHLAGVNNVAAQPGHIRTMLFANAGAGPLLREDIVPPQPAWLPVGFTGFFKSAPSVGEWANADGRALAPIDYPELFGLIGYTYGKADNSDFCLPVSADVSGSLAFARSWYPISMMNGMALTLPDGRIMGLGGHNGTTAVSNVYIGTVTASAITWVAGTSMPYTSNMGAAVMLKDGRILITGGRNASQVEQANTYFGTVSGNTITWTQGSNMPTANAYHKLIQLPDGRILIGGGATSSAFYFGTISGTTITWSAAVAHPTGSYCCPFQRLPSGKLLLIDTGNTGGAVSWKAFLGTISGSNITWAETSKGSPVHAHYGQLLNLPDGRLLFSAGVAISGTYLPPSSLYLACETALGIEWQQVAALPYLLLNTNQQQVLTQDNELIQVAGLSTKYDCTNAATAATLRGKIGALGFRKIRIK